MKVFVTGATGFIGPHLVRRLADAGHQVFVLDRSPEKARPMPGGAVRVEGDGTVSGAWQEEVSRCDAVINLAGITIFQRWNARVKEQLTASRIDTTRNVVDALRARRGVSTRLLSGSAIGYYGSRGDETLNEGSVPAGDFMARMARDWENAALEAESLGVKVAVCRFGIVLGKNGGALGQMLPLFRLGLGSPLGAGKQWFSWIHVDDLVAGLIFLLQHEEVVGPVNLTAPEPVRNSEFTRALGKAIKRPTFLPAVPGLALRLALGQVAQVLVEGQRVLPDRLLKSGFKFRYPTLQDALRDLVTA